MAIDKQYIKQATDEYNPQYNSKVTALKNQLAQNKLTLDQQKTGINTNYNTQVTNQNLNSLKAKNNLSNTVLGRGLANSSIATSGLAEQDNINNRAVGMINSARTGALNDIDAQKALAEQNTNANLTQLEGDKQSAIMALARQIAEKAWEQNFQTDQFNFSKSQAQIANAFKNRELAMQLAAQQAQQAYQSRALAVQQSNSQAELAYKYAMMKADQENSRNALAWDKEKFANTPNSTIADRLSYLAQIGGDDSLTTAQKLSKVGAFTNAFDGQKGYESLSNAGHSTYGDLLRQQAKENLARNQGTSSSSSSSGFWSGLKDNWNPSQWASWLRSKTPVEGYNQ